MNLPLNDVLFDKLIAVHLFKRNKSKWDNLSIDSFSCPSLKPDIQLSLNMIQGGIATEFKLVIGNFVPPTDIGDYTTLVIKAGYRTKLETREFTCAIFSSYVETPNPNGKMVFNGLVGNWFINNLRESARNIIFKKAKVTVAELLYGIVEGKDKNGMIEAPSIKGGGLNLKLVMDLPTWIKEDELDIGGSGTNPLTYWVESGYACLNWLMDRISTYSNQLVLLRQKEGKPDYESYRILMWLDDDTLRVGMKGYSGIKDTTKIRWVDLNRVTMVSFQGAALNVIAPWNPSLVPGDLFHMQSRYFRGRLTTQSIRAAAKDPNDLYRVITMNVIFDTNGSNNTMKILAVKNAAFIQEEGLVKDKTAVEQIPEELKTNILSDDNPDIDIVFGKDTPDAEETKVIKKSWGVNPSTFAETEGIIRTIIPGETIASIAEEVYGAIEYTKTAEEGNIEHLNETIHGASFWPLIVAGTQCMYLKGLEGFKNYEKHPDLVIEGEKVFIPTMTNPDDMKKHSSILSSMADAWESLPEYSSFFVTQSDIDTLRIIVYFMGL
jgi:hypothetical protein